MVMLIPSRGLRVYEIARLYKDVNSRTVLRDLRGLGLNAKSSSSIMPPMLVETYCKQRDKGLFNG